eukprot:CAMPEP_0176403904 /NCGR_PEP_ID=MMETSP0126-20121128/50449_1 /TAXON_ID=141414 ORGANISM="Strombidinopsis acuminatum, Strain SPMC142" /NCGR_SAMPLE_ID=MMETSP0126 /ASSEMBLY_ACC=CAM_ASM_000229 /LENGTH=45 /DNA_ID= /DNA_START= /DNA_END= /DNA_ORIENTATION=
MEEDDLLEHQEVLANLMEAYTEFNASDSEDDDDDDDVDGDDIIEK